MSLRRQMIATVPEETERVARAAFPKGNVYMNLRDEIGPVYADSEFVELYPVRGQPAEAPWRLAMVTVMQFAEGLTDRQAADAVRGRIDWKYALSLELTDAGFHYSVLSEFRDRLVTGGAAQLLLETLLKACEAKNLLTGKGSQRTDSTHMLAAIRQLNRLELVGETLRRALDDLSQVAPEWLRVHLLPEWGERYSKPFDSYRLPKTPAKREALAEAIGRDGHYLLNAIFQPGTPPNVRTLASIETLRRVWVQQYYVDEDGDSHWRSSKSLGLPPAHRMIASPDDLEARLSTKRDLTWTGYKVHVTDHPRLITHVATTPATTHDVKLTDPIQRDLAAQNLKPQRHIVDGGYLEADVLMSSRQQGIDLIGPVPADKSWQATTEGALDHAQFQIDWDRKQAICPAGKTSIYYMEGITRRSGPNVHFTFSAADCHACPLQTHCTRAKEGGRTLTIYPQQQYEVLQAARQRQKTEEFKRVYRTRAGVEGTISQAVNAMDLRVARYHGLAKTHLQNVATAAAINLVRAARWLMGDRPRKTQVSPFASFALQF